MIGMQKNGMSGAKFYGGQPHEAYKSANLLRRKCDEYFNLCDLNSKNYTVPGLALYLGMRTRAIIKYQGEIDHPDYQRMIDYALQRIEAFTCERLFETKGNTKGIEFLLQNTQNYSNKSSVDSKTQLEVTEKEKIQRLADPEVKGRLLNILPKIQGIVDKKMQEG